MHVSAAPPGVSPRTEGRLLRLSGNGRDRLAFDHLWITPVIRPRGFVWSAVESTEERVVACDKMAERKVSSSYFLFICSHLSY